MPNEVEIIDILNFKPERLGHCVCIHPNLKGSNELFQKLLELKIPVGLYNFILIQILIMLIEMILINYIFCSKSCVLVQM